MATGARGEGYIDGEGQQHPVLFTNRAIAEAERALGKGIVEIARGAESLVVNDLVRLAVIGLEHARRDRKEPRRSYTTDDAYALLDEYGITAVATAIYQALAAVMTYSRGTDDNPPA